MLLIGRVAVVAGVAGLGRPVARALAREGAALVLADPDDAVLATVKADVASRGAAVRTVSGELTDPASGDRLVQIALDAFGQLDVLVSNAGGPAGNARFAKSDLDAWRQALDATLFASLQIARAAIIPMRAARRGSIVFVNAGVLRSPAVGAGAAAASYGALLTASQVLARELGPSNIRVNSIVPRPAGNASDADGDAAADAVVFLASDLASVVTGQSLDVHLR